MAHFLYFFKFTHNFGLNRILWLVPNESMKKFIKEQIKSYNFKNEQHHIEIFNISKFINYNIFIN